VSPLVFGELTIEPIPSTEGGAIDVFWRGRSLARHPAPTIVPYVSTILADAARTNRAVRLHFETIELMNSSTITAVIQIIREARQKKARLDIMFDPDMDWQKLSFDALGVLLQGDDSLRLVEVDVKAQS
jgi:hypothetical protein